MKSKLTDADYATQAKAIGVEPAALKAVAQVEAPYGGFLPDDQVAILFERHWFHRLTFGKHSKLYPSISNPSTGGYIGGIGEHKRLERAAALDRVAALQSASWGKFQIMGFNWAHTGAASLQDFINRVHRSEQAQMDLFIGFLRSKGLITVLQGKPNFDRFAYVYNGQAHKKHNYAGRMGQAYRMNGGIHHV